MVICPNGWKVDHPQVGEIAETCIRLPPGKPGSSPHCQGTKLMTLPAGRSWNIPAALAALKDHHAGRRHLALNISLLDLSGTQLRIRWRGESRKRPAWMLPERAFFIWWTTDGHFPGNRMTFVHTLNIFMLAKQKCYAFKLFYHYNHLQSSCLSNFNNFFIQKQFSLTNSGH